VVTLLFQVWTCGVRALESANIRTKNNVSETLICSIVTLTAARHSCTGQLQSTAGDDGGWPKYGSSVFTP